MFKNLLVPLDGSKLAESVLPAVDSLATILNTRITLLHIIEEDARPEVHHDRHLTHPLEAEVYLNKIAKQFSVPVNIHVHTTPTANVASSIVNYAEEECPPDIIILASHGNGGLHDLFFGSIAQQVVCSGSTPVLLIKSREEPFPFKAERILVPLDNESNHDAVLPFVEEFSRSLKAQVDFLCVIPTRGTDSGAHAAAGTMLPMTASAYLDMAEEIANDHLFAHKEELEKAGIVATAEIIRGDPATIITRIAETEKVDLLLFGTHGKVGLDAFWNRSVTAAVAQRSAVPLLLIPVT